MGKEYWKAVALVVGTQIGAGVLGLPYAIKGLGFFWGSVSILLAGFLMMLTALFLVEALYRTNPNYHLFELVEHHFGRTGGIVFMFLIVLAVYGALTAYLSGMSESLNRLLGLDTLWTGILLWAVLSYAVVRGLRFSSAVESAAVTLLLILFGVVLLWSIPYITPYHIPLTEAQLDAFFTAFTVSVFAFFAHLIIPEVVKIVRSKETAARVIYHSFIITSLVYVLFSLSVIGVLADSTPEISIFGLVDVFGAVFSPIAYLIPLFTMFTSFLGVALGTTDMLREFLRKRVISASIVLVPPLVAFLLGYRFFGSIVFGSLGLILAGGVVPSLLLIKLKRSRMIPYRVWIAGLSLIVFVFVFLWDLKTMFMP